jgi:hypothetical protein
MFDWIPLIGNWGFSWQVLFLSIMITLPCLFLLARSKNYIEWRLGRGNKLATILVPILSLTIILVGITLYTVSIVSGIIIPSVDWSIHWQVLALAFSSTLIMLPAFFMFSLNEDYAVFTMFFGPHYQFLSRKTMVISMAIILAILVLVVGFIAFGSVVLIPTVISLSGMSVAIIFATTLCLILLTTTSG